MRMKPVEHMLLIVLTGFLAATTIAGGIGLLAGAIPLPVEWLHGSPFRSYAIPGLTLLVIVGGSASIATVLLLLRHTRAVIAAVFAGAMIMAFDAQSRAPHGGIFVFFAIENVIAFVLSIVAGAVLGAVLVTFLKGSVGHASVESAPAEATVAA